jgi:hypothetical protein
VIYYHLSTNLKHNGIFKPGIPPVRHKEQEDATIPRVSVAPEMSDCFMAIPGGGTFLENLNLEQRGYYLIFKIDTEKLGIHPEHIVSSEPLYEKDLVRDAGVTNECWITVPFTVPKEDTFMIRLQSWGESPEDILPHSIYAIADEKYEGNYIQAYEETYQKHVPSAVSIHDLDYVHENVTEGEEVTLFFDNEQELQTIQTYIEHHLQVENIDVRIDEFSFKMKENTNIRPLFMKHAEVAMLFI